MDAELQNLITAENEGRLLLQCALRKARPAVTDAVPFFWLGPGLTGT